MDVTTTATISVLGITPVDDARRLLALADITLMIDGVEIVIHGIQVRAGADGTEISLPRYRATNGEWRSALSLPEELRRPMGGRDLSGKGGLEER